MAKKAAHTGTQKKALKQQAKAEKVQAELYQKQAPAEYKQRKNAAGEIKEIGKGKHIPEYKGKTKYEPSKFKQKTEYEHKTLGQLTKDFERAGRGLEPMFEQRKQAALADFSQNVAPQISNAAGASDSGKSSAVRQAIAGAQGNLHRNLSADFEGMRNQIAGGLLNSREQQRQFSAQFGGSQEQFYNQLRNQQEQYGSQFAGQQEQNIYNSQLHELQSRLQAQGALFGSPVQTNFQPLQSPYLQPGGGGVSAAGGAISGGIAGAGTGAAIGSVVPGLGTALGAGIGGILGAGGGYLNAR